MTLFARPRGEARRAVALVVVLLALALLFVVAVGVAALGAGNLNVTAAQVNGEKAFFAAEAAGQHALLLLKQDAAFSGLSGETLYATAETTYDVEVFNPGQTVPATGLVVPGGATYLLCTGHYADRVSRRIGLLVRRSGSASQSYAAFADELIEIYDGAEIDSWNSVVGGYLVSKLLGDNAHIATNSNNSQAIKLLNNSKLFGSAYAGPTSPPDGVSPDASSEITGASTTLTAAIPLPPVVMPEDPMTGSDATVTGSLTLTPTTNVCKDVFVNGGELHLEPGGVYVFNKLSLVNGGKIVYSGGPAAAPAKVVVLGEFLIENGGIANASLIPRNLKFEVQQGPIKLKDNGSSAYYSLYAPAAEAIVEAGAQIYGSLVCRKLMLKDGSKLHYDKALATSMMPGGESVQILSHERL